MKEALAKPGFGARVRGHVRELARLAAPVIAARFGVMAMALVNTLMVGHYGAADLAYLGLALSPIGVVMLTALGLLMGTMVAAAQAYGGGRLKECGAAWRRALPLACGLGAISVVVCWFGEEILLAAGQEPLLAREGGRVVLVLGLGLPPYLLFLACTFFLEGIKRPLPGMILMIVANLVNALLNWVLVFGHLGLPAGGAVGSAWATTLARAFLGLGGLLMVWNLRDHEAFGIRERAVGGWRAGRAQRRIGFAAGLSLFVESGSFAVLNQMSGWLGVAAAAAYAIGINALSLVFMIAVGIGAATAVRVGHALGRGDRSEAALAGWTGLAANSVCMLVVGTAISAFAGEVAGAYTRDAAVVPLAAAALAYFAAITLLDGGQGVMGTALRGCGETWVPTLLYALTYIALMIPAGWLLAFPMGHGVAGLFEAILIASVASLAAQAGRFHLVVRQASSGRA